MPKCNKWVLKATTNTNITPARWLKTQWLHVKWYYLLGLVTKLVKWIVWLSVRGLKSVLCDINDKKNSCILIYQFSANILHVTKCRLTFATIAERRWQRFKSVHAFNWSCVQLTIFGICIRICSYLNVGTEAFHSKT